MRASFGYVHPIVIRAFDHGSTYLDPPNYLFRPLVKAFAWACRNGPNGPIAHKNRTLRVLADLAIGPSKVVRDTSNHIGRCGVIQCSLFD